MQLADRVNRIQESPTLAVTARAAKLKAEGKDIIGLGAGEPDFDTPQHIKDAAIAAINAGKTKYTPVGGTPSLKQAVINKFQRDNGLSYKPSQVLVSSGGKQSFFNLALALLNSGDEVIIPTPYWVSYPDMVLVADGKPVIVQTSQQQNFKMSPEQLAAAITPKTRLVVINSPSNPSGVAYNLDELKALAGVLRKHPQILIATDDMYEHILFGGKRFVNILNAAPELYDRTIVLNGVSKAYSMTGWRIGYAAGPEALIAEMNKVQSQSTSNPCSIAQAAAEAALNGPQNCVAEMCKAFEERHDFLHRELNRIEGIDCLPSDGTFYAFPSVVGAMRKMGIADDLAFCERLLVETGVAAVPGSAFGAPGNLRLSFAVGMTTLQDAASRIRRFVEGNGA